MDSRVPCRPAHRRRLLFASLAFAACVLLITWLVAAFILRDLSESYVSRIIAQAQDEAEAIAHLSSDESGMGEADETSRIETTKDAAIDPEALLDPLLPRLYDEGGQPVAPIDMNPEMAGEPALSSPSRPVEAPRVRPRRLPARLERSGQEWQVLLDGQLVARDAIQFIGIQYEGGRSDILFRRVDRRLVDPKDMADESRVTRVAQIYRPRSQPLSIEWDSTLDGEPVKLEAAIDRGILNEGVAELRRQMIPRVAAGGMAFIALLGCAYAYVVRLLGEARRLEIEANQRAMLAQVGMLAAGLAHEIRNPLSAVKMNLQLLEEDLAGDRGKRRSEAVAEQEDVALLRSTQREIARLAALVSDFLSYARPAQPRRAPTDVDALVRDCVRLFEPMAEGAGVTLEIELQAGPRLVELDEAMIKQALMNVVVNALEAVRESAGHVVVATRSTSSAVVVSVTDDGPGLPSDPEELFRVFHSTKKGGTGLGLAISRALVERHGGTLTARPGETRGSGSAGAVFTLTLPARGGA